MGVCFRVLRKNEGVFRSDKQVCAYARLKVQLKETIQLSINSKNIPRLFHSMKFTA